MNGKLRASELLKAPFIQIKSKVTIPGYTNGIPNIKDEYKYVLAQVLKR